MIPRRTSKFIKSLQIKKYRQQHDAFLIQGKKPVQELLASSWDVKYVVYARGNRPDGLERHEKRGVECYEVSSQELTSLGTLKSNDSVIAVANTFPDDEFRFSKTEGAILYLDEIRDPGNLGTMIRIADWYNIKAIVASLNTVEIWNPKVVNASMGSFLRIPVYYRDFLTTKKLFPDKHIYALTLEGENIHQLTLKQEGIYVIGNESEGVSSSILTHVDTCLTIPKFGNAESLNAGIATAICCDRIAGQGVK